MGVPRRSCSSTAGAAEISRVGPEEVSRELVDSAAALLRNLVTAGAALGWVEPPSASEVQKLLSGVADETGVGDTALVVARCRVELAGLAYWRRYARPTQRPHADVEKVAVDPSWQGRGVGRALMQELTAAAAQVGVEVLTLDLRGDNLPAAALYESFGFRRYGLLERFVAVGEARYDKLCYALDLRRPPPEG